MFEVSAFRFGNEHGQRLARPYSERALYFDEPDVSVAGIAEALAVNIECAGVSVFWGPRQGGEYRLATYGDCDPANCRPAPVHRNGDRLRSQWHSVFDDETAALAIAIPVAGGVITTVAFFDREGDAATALSTGKIDRLTPFLRAFFENWTRGHAHKARAEAMTAAIDASGICVVLLDREGHQVFANAAANRLLDRADGLRRKGAALVGRSLADTMKLNAAIDQAVGSDASDVDAGRSNVPLARASASALIATVIGTGAGASSGSSAAAILYVIDPDQAGHGSLESVCKLYGLSRMESRLASAIALGESLADAARNIGVQPQTARSYLKHIFLKTDTRRQADLVRLLITGAASISSVLRARAPAATPVWG